MTTLAIGAIAFGRTYQSCLGNHVFIVFTRKLGPKTQFLDNLVRMPILLFIKRESPFFPKGSCSLKQLGWDFQVLFSPRGTLVQYSKSSSLSQATWLGWPLNPLLLMKRFLFHGEVAPYCSLVGVSKSLFSQATWLRIQVPFSLPYTIWLGLPLSPLLMREVAPGGQLA